jgi:sugar lactone lactonase YvrE
MKILLTPCFILLLITVAGCKKHSHEEEAPKKAIVTTIAGSGNGGYLDGAAADARFYAPSDVAVHTDGTVYVVDRNNLRIRKIVNGQVSTVAGNGNSAVVDTIGLYASFVTPHCITLNASGNLFILDANDPRIRKVAPNTTVSTYAGASTEGYIDGPASIAKFRYSNGIAADAQGNVYVADAGNNCIRKITPNGIVSTLAGGSQVGYQDGTGAAARFNAPYGLAVDTKGNVYVCDVLNYRIRKITPAGVVTTLAGNGTNGSADGDRNTAQFEFLEDMVADKNGNLYVTDVHRIRKISPTGKVTTIAGSTYGYADGEGANAKFAAPNGLGIDAQGNIYVADHANQRIRKISFE